MMKTPVLCEMCNYLGRLSTYKPCWGYNDIRCPECGSTKNAHNRAYMAKLMEKADIKVGDVIDCSGK